MTDNIINLADHRPATPPRPGRFTRLARWSDDALCTLVVAAGLCTIGWLPGHVIKWIAWSDVPWYLDVFLTSAPAVLVGMWATLAFHRLQRRSPDGCSINVHVFEDEVASTCKCGATGDVDGDGAA
jgi:hypothetical protein